MGLIMPSRTERVNAPSWRGHIDNMTIQEAQNLLRRLFEPLDRDKPADERRDGVCFTREALSDDGGELHDVQQIVSRAQQDSGLSCEFSYRVADKAVDILCEIEPEEWSSDDFIEAIDSAVPIYTGELMEIYQSNAWIVDEAVKEIGNADSTTNAQAGWYKAITDMVYAIKNGLDNIIDA